MKREDEERCKSIFDTYLLSLFDRQEIIWTPGDEPPDFFLELASRRLAVEVTTLIEGFDAGPPNGLSLLGVISEFRRLVDRAASLAKQEGNLSGGYAIAFGEPFETFSQIERQLESGLLSYMRSTLTLDSAPEKVLYERSGQRLAIAKVHNESTEVQILWTPGMIYANGIASEICNLIREILLKKTDRLRNLNLPKILLIRDLYGFGQYGLGNPETRASCAASLTESLRVFQAVFAVQDNKDGFTFYPEESRWSKELFVGAPS